MSRIDLIKKLLDHPEDVRTRNNFWFKRAMSFDLRDIDPRSDWIVNRSQNHENIGETWTCYSTTREEFLTKDSYSYCFSRPKWTDPNEPTEDPKNPHVFTSKAAVLEALLLYLSRYPDNELAAAL